MLFFTSSSTALRRSSNSPRYFAPATSAPISREYSFLFFRFSGTSPRTIRCARPSTMAVLPTPGSPIITGLFLDFRDRMRMECRISSSLPITGSSLLSRASCVRSTPYLFMASYVPSRVVAGYGLVAAELLQRHQKRIPVYVVPAQKRFKFPRAPAPLCPASNAPHWCNGRP